MNYTVYKHTCPNGKVYIGITSTIPERRWERGKKYKNNIYFTRAINKYGWDNIKHEILLTKLTKKEACEKEIELIIQYKSNDRKYGYNLSAGGEVSSKGCIRRMETKNKISKANKGKKRTNEQKEYIKLRCTEASGKPVLYHEYKLIVRDKYIIDLVRISKYKSINEASRITGKTTTTISKHCGKEKHRETETYFKYIDK